MSNFKKILTLLFLNILFFPIITLASNEVTLKVDKNDLQTGDVVTVDAEIPSDLKLYALTATLNYDRNVFEEISNENFVGQKDVVELLFNPENNRFGLINKTGEISSSLFRIRLRVKKNATAGATNITLTNISSSDGENQTNFKKANVELTITRDAKNEETIPTNNKKSFNETKEEIIKVFTNEPIIIGAAIGTILLLICLIFIIIKKRDKKIIILTSSALAIFIILLSALLIFNDAKKDINNDGNKDYNDAKEILKYLINMQGTKPQENNNSDNNNSNNQSSTSVKPSKPSNKYDVNNDGKVDVNDAGHSTGNTTEKTNYKVTLRSRENNDNLYTEKGKITFEFSATVTPNEKLKEVMIDGKYYPVILNNNYYTVTLDTPNTSGIHEFKFTKAKLVNNREINTELIIIKEILKDEPYVDEFNFDEETDTLTFLLKDKENSFKNGYIIIEDKENKEVYRKELANENSLTYEFAKEQDYTIQIFATFDRDTNGLNSITGNKNLYENKNIYNHTLSINSNYDFKISNISITDAIEKGQKPVIEFTSTNNKGYIVEYIEINGHRYKVNPKYEKNHYQAELTELNTDTFGRYHINIDKIEISNYKVFNLNQDYTMNPLSYTVLKVGPKVDNIKIEDDKQNERLFVDYHIVDQDKTLSHLNLVLVNSNNKIITKLNDVQNGNRIPVSYKDNVSGGYQVRFLADYNLGTDRHNYSEVNVGEKAIVTQTDVKITKIEVGKINQNNKFELTPYPTKGQTKYQIKIYVNISPELRAKYNRISGATINGLNYDGGTNAVNGETGDGGTTITLTIPNESGIIDLNITRVKLAFESYQGVSQAYFAIAPYETKIDVLKDQPTIKDLKILDEDYENGIVKFRFYVQDDKGGFEKGTVTLGEETHDIKYGENEITFTKVPQDKELNLNFKGTYDLDTNTIAEEKLTNYYTDTEIYQTTYGLYNPDKYENIKLSDITTNGQNNRYFEKLAKINLSFKVVNNELPNLNRIIVEGKEYQLTKHDDMYEAEIDGYNTAGLKKLIITDLILSNGKKISLKDENSIQIEVLKDKISIYDFKFEDNEDNIKIKLNLKDNDNAIYNRIEDNVKVNLYNEDNELISSYPFNKEITINKDGTIRYYVKVYGNYDRDIKIDDINHFTNVLLLDEVISLDKNYIEMKKITDVTLYKNTIEKITAIETVTVSDIEAHPENYFVKINMEKLPTVHAKIKRVLIENNHLILVLDYEYVIREKNEEKQDLRIDFGLIENGEVTNSARPATIAQIIEQIKKDPSSNITLGADIDLSTIDISTDYIFDVEYTGIFNGNNYRIKNLDRPLFKTIKNGTIKNLKLDTIKLNDSKYKGAIANSISNTTISNIIINRLNINNSTENVGGLVGEVTNNSLIEKSKIQNLIIKGTDESRNTGGLIGKLENSKLYNNIADGTITANTDYIGGLVGNATNSEFKNNIAAVEINNGPAKIANISCYFAYSSSPTSTFIDNVAKYGQANNGFTNNAKEIRNNYNLLQEDKESTENGVTNVRFHIGDEAIIEIYQQAHFDTKIWNMSTAIYEGYPIFMAETNSILDLDQVIDDYEEEKEYHLYGNLIKLTPFYDSKKIAKNAKNISNNSNLATKNIKHLIPLDTNGNIVTYLTTSDYNKITKLKIVYEDNTLEVYEVKFDKLYDMVASYRITSLKTDYTFNHYLIDNNSQLVNNLTNYLNNLNYDDNLDPLTPGSDSRLYKEFYNDTTKKELREFVLKYISITNQANGNTNEAISDYLEREIKDDENFIKTLYVYNYFRRFYDIDIAGMKLYDFILFDSTGFDSEMNTKNIVNAYLKDSKNFDTNRTSDVYTNILSQYTKQSNIPNFLDYLVTTLTKEKTADWFANEFKGYLVELDVKNRPDIEYRLWDHIKTQDKNTGVTWYNYALPILTLPERAAYIISTPGQFVIGAERTYINDPFNAEEQKAFQERVAIYTTRMSDYYNTTALIINDAEVFNSIHTIQIDKRFTYENGILTNQNPYSTEEPFHKNFNEVIGQWAYPDGNAATANGAYIIWRAEGCLDGNWTYSTWSHETAHNMDARLFLKNYGRRFDAGGEDYADGNLTQSFGPADIVMNLSSRYNKGDRIAANLTPDRINSPAKIQDFYQKLFDTVYIMDYIEGQAFLKLPVEEQAALVVEVTYPREKTNTLAGHEYLKRQHSFYSEVSLEEYKSWNIQTLDDLYDHHLVMYPGVIASTITTNRYGGPNINQVRWYMPHNDEGRPDSYSIKWWAYEMLGYAGYDAGYIEYYSNRNSIKKTIANVASDGKSYVFDDNGNKKESNVDYKTDLMALQTITGNNNITFKVYRQQRFNEVKTNLAYIQQINVNDYFIRFYNALREDAKAVITKRQEAEEKYPVDSDNYVANRNNYIINSKVKNFNNSTVVRQDLYYTIKNGTDDFNGKVYDKNKPQQVTEFVIPTE